MAASRDDPRLVVRDLVAALEAEPAFQDAVPELAKGLGTALGWDAVVLWTRDAPAGVLRCATVWARERDWAKRLEQLCRETTFTEGEGIPGRAWRSRVPIWSTDPSGDGRLSALTDEPGLPGDFAVPLVADDRVVGVVELIARDHHELDVGVQRGLAAAGTELAAALARRIAEEAAGSERARLEVALAAGSMGVWDWDLQTNRLRWSEALQRMMGLVPGTFGGRVEGYLDLVHPDDRQWVIESYLQQFEHRGDHHIRIEHRIVRPDGSLRWMEIRGRALRDPVGTLVTMTGVALDVTDAVDRAQANRAHRAQLDLAMDVTGFATWEFDRQRRLGRWSESLVALVGHDVDPEAVTVEQLVAVLHPDDRGAADAMLEAAMAGRDFHARYRIVRPDGAVRELEAWGRPLHDAAGELMGMAGITIDLTGTSPGR